MGCTYEVEGYVILYFCHPLPDECPMERNAPTLIYIDSRVEKYIDLQAKLESVHDQDVLLC